MTHSNGMQARVRGTVIFLGDGMADEGLASLGGRTPIEAARTPAMDRLAREGRSGTLLTLPGGYPTSSEVANMSVLGCDLEREYCGRGPLEAAGRGIPIRPDDLVFRLNLVSCDQGRLQDYSAGQIEPADAGALIEALNRAFGSPGLRFHPGVSYRNLLVLAGSARARGVRTEKPDDHHGDAVEDFLPEADPDDGPAVEAAATLRRLIREAPAVLDPHPVNRARTARGLRPANGIWPWSGGSAGAFLPLEDRFGIRGAVITAVDVIAGLGRCLGMEVISVPGATGYIDTNYEGKADAALDALARCDLVYVHVEGTDEVSHARNLGLKIRAIEDFDRRLIARVLAGAPGVNAAVLADHPVPVATGKHTRTPVPVAVRMQGMEPDRVQTYGETAALQGALGALQGDGLMRILFDK